MFSKFYSLLCEVSSGTSAQASTASEVNEAAGQAQQSAQQGGFSWGPIIMIVAMIAIFYFLLIRPQQKKQKQITQMRESMKAGDNVVTAGGIYGKIVEVKDNAFIIQVAEGMRLKVDKNSVYASMEDVAATQGQK